MKSKQEKSMICNICKLGIDYKEHYCILLEYIDDKEKSKGFYHVSCYRDRFIVPNQKLKSLMNKSTEILKNVGVEI